MAHVQSTSAASQGASGTTIGPTQCAATISDGAVANAPKNASAAASGDMGGGGGRNTTPLAAASFFRSGYRGALATEPPKKKCGTPPASAESDGVAGRGGEHGGSSGRAQEAAEAAERRERATILESRSLASAPGRRKRWRSSDP